MSQLAISVHELGKQYRIVHQTARYGRLTESLTGLVRAPLDRIRGKGQDDVEWFWALRDVSFDVRFGDVVGIIGRNGAGKSTLLKLLSRITEPTRGRAELHGRVASLLEIGTGFHPELTGRENIYLSGSVLGMRKDDIDRRFDEIVAFAGIEQFLDTPTKRYSSGMQVRLGFAVAAHLEPEILIVDEVLAVGDAAFQRKSIAKMGDVASSGRTVLVVSHNLAIVESLCTRALLLDRGRQVADGLPGAVIGQYIGAEGSVADGHVSLLSHEHRLPGMTPYLTGLRILTPGGTQTSVTPMGDPVVVEVTYDASACGERLAGAGIIVTSTSGARVGGFNTYMAFPPPHTIPQVGSVRFRINAPVLAPGAFTVTASLGTHPGTLVDKVEHAITFVVEQRDIYGTGYILTSEDGATAFDCEVECMADGFPTQGDGDG
jgi:lipopolysaccharide transport system ATP-binding protein